MSEDPTRLRMTRHLTADPERVWRAWTEEWAQWLWPDRFETVAELDPRAGGAYRVSAPNVGMGVSGVVVGAVAPSRLVLTWRWDGETDETLVTVELHEVEDGTELVLLHEQHAEVGQRDDHVEGWTHCLGRLEAHVAG